MQIGQASITNLKGRLLVCRKYSRNSFRLFSVNRKTSHVGFSGDLEPDVMLPPPPGGADIALFGVVHGDPNCSRSADFILRYKPEAVVVETSLNHAHGSVHENSVRLQDALRMTPDGPLGMIDGRTRALAHVSDRLSRLTNPAESEVWLDFVSSPWFSNEHMAYAAAFAVSAELIAGDRPKAITYQRLLWLPDIVDLDRAFGLQSALNYHDLVSGMISPFGGSEIEQKDVVEEIFISERDAALLWSLHNASLKVGEGQNKLIVGIVGASHLSGMQRLWKDETEWRNLASKALQLPSPHHITKIREDGERLGVRRALLEALLRLSCRSEVLSDLNSILGPPSRDIEKSYSLTHETYGNCRMLLAVLDKDQLSEVCQGWRCDMWSVLEPVRNVRPCNGGRGYDETLILELRMLNYELN